MTLQQLFKKRGSWTQGVEARDRFGDAVPPKSERAVCWCLRGATYKCYGTREKIEEVFRKLHDAIKEEIGHGQAVSQFNDYHLRRISHVRAVVRKAGV